MSVYDIDGNIAQGVCKTNRTKAINAYSIGGTQIYALNLKVMEYNVGGWYDGSGSNVPAASINTYYNLQAQTIQDNDPDVMLINEYWSQFSDSGYSALSFLQQFFPYVYAVPYPDHKSYGRAICAKYPITGYQNHTYTGYSPRYYDSMIMTINNTEITLVVTHLGLTVEERQAEAAQLITYLESLQTPFICAGDLNTAKTSTTTADDYVNVIQPLLNAGFHLANMGDFGRLITYKNTEKGNGALDNIIVSHNLTIASAYVSTEKETAELPTQIDHMPLVANVLLTN